MGHQMDVDAEYQLADEHPLVDVCHTPIAVSTPSYVTDHILVNILSAKRGEKMNFECIIYEKDQGIGIIKLNRPKVLNAMNKQLWLDFQTALEDAKRDTHIKVLVVTGEGRAFSTGADLKESKTRSLEEYRDYLEELQEASRKIIRFEKPTIAAINGYALGSGYELALACDIRIAAEEAQIGSPEATVTSSVTGGAFRLVQDLIGPGKAKELLYTGEYIDGKEAERIGLVNKSVPIDNLETEVRKMAQKIAANSTISLKMIKKGLQMARGEISLDALMDFEIEACLTCVSTKERQESLQAFEQRKK
ncbi:MAG: enoyl-CoA hydratase/isomerase family protein [Desulfobacterales bacterium]|jgi:enoyl-CoA hydratase